MREVGIVTCAIDWCDRPRRTMEWCSIHYGRKYHGRDMQMPIQEHVKGRLCTIGKWGVMIHFPLTGPLRGYRYSRYPEFYMPMCVKCHRALDGARHATELFEYRLMQYIFRDEGGPTVPSHLPEMAQ